MCIEIHKPEEGSQLKLAHKYEVTSHSFVISSRGGQGGVQQVYRDTHARGWQLAEAGSQTRGHLT